MPIGDSRKNDSGIILMTVLWAVVILTILAVSLGRSASLQLALTKHSIGKVRAKYLGWAGLIYAIEQIRLDSEDTNSNLTDTLYYCGIKMDENNPPVELFKKRSLTTGFFEIFYEQENPVSGKMAVYPGFQDEERKININALTTQNIGILSSLIVLLGFDQETAQGIAFAVLDWKDGDDNVSHERYGAEDDYYMGLIKKYHCKNLAFDSKEELLLVKGMSKEVFAKLKDFITVFPKDGPLLINFDTASKEVLTALARSFAGPTTNTDISDADSAVEKILAYRQGDDGKDFTHDDRSIKLIEINFNAKENVLAQTMNQFRTQRSEYIRIKVKGYDDQMNVESVIEAVIHRGDLSIMDWQSH